MLFERRFRRTFPELAAERLGALGLVTTVGPTSGKRLSVLNSHQLNVFAEPFCMLVSQFHDFSGHFVTANRQSTASEAHF